MKKLALTAIPFFILTISSSNAFANDHLVPDITDFDNPYVAFRTSFSAQVLALKGKKSAGDKPTALRAEVNQFTLGFKKERVDNRYSLIGFSYSTSANGDLDYTRSEIIIQNHYQLKYGEGRHVGSSGNIDWNIFIAIESGDYQLGFDTKSEIGLGLGGEVLYSLTSWFDVGAQISISNQIQSVSLGADINF